MVEQLSDKFILYSGGAKGTDTLFGTNAEKYGIKEQNYSFRGHKNCRTRGRVILDDAQLARANYDLLAVIGKPFKKHQGTGNSTEKYWQRNWYQVQKVKEIFAVVKDINSFLDFTETKTKIEGAGVPMAIAIKTKGECKRICVYDIKSGRWYVWNRDPCNSSNSGIEVDYCKLDVDNSNEAVEKVFFEEVEESKLKIIETGFAGIGTREIDSNGVDAVNRLFERSLLTQSYDLIIKNATVINPSASNRSSFYGDIYIKGKSIVKIMERTINRIDQKCYESESIKDGNDKINEIDAKGAVLTPGFVNGHIHSYRKCLHHLPNNDDLHDKIKSGIQKDSEAVTVTLEASYLEAIKSGITYGCDFVKWDNNTPELPFEIAYRVGLKGCFLVNLSHDSKDESNQEYFCNEGHILDKKEQIFIDHDMERMEKLFSWLAQDDKYEDYHLGINIPWENQFKKSSKKKNNYTESTLSFINNLIGTIRDKYRNIRIVPFMHFAEQKERVDHEKFRKLMGYENIKKGLVLFHGIHIGEEEKNTITENSKSLGGIVTFPKKSRAGSVVPLGDLSQVNIGIGSDYTSWDIMSLFDQLYRLHTDRMDPITFEEVFDLSTCRGAKVFGIENHSIKAGNLADFIIFNLYAPPLFNPEQPGEVIDSMLRNRQLDAGNLQTVIINGKVVVNEQKATFVNEEEVRMRFNNKISKIYANI